MMAGILRVPDPCDSDVALARYYGDDVAYLELRELVVELRRADVAIALVRREDDRDWWLRRRARVRAELARRRLVAD